MATPGGIVDRINLHNAAVATATGDSIEVGNSHGGGNFPVVSFQLIGTFTASVAFEGTVDGTNWVAFRCANVATGVVATTATAEGVYRGASVGFWKVRANMTWTSGTSITVKAMRVVTSPMDEAMLQSVAITSVVPGTSATSLGKAEDAVHASGDTGVMALAVRKDTAAAVAADGDYHPIEVDGSGRLWVQVGALPDIRESWRISTLSFTTTNDSTETFTVPATTEYQVLSIYVTLASTATVGNRQMVVQPLSSGDVVLGEIIAAATQAASLTYRYMFGPGLADLTAVRDTTYLSVAMTPLFLGAGQKLKVFDKAAVDAAADDMTIQIQIASRSVA